MIGSVTRALGAVLIVSLLVSVPASAAETFARAQATVLTEAGGRFVFAVEMASTERQRAQGLQGRPALAANAGMLFDFGAPKPVTMWMKDTVIALDMMFVGADGRIVNIAADTVPLSLTIIESDGPARAVLEVPGGTAARLGIRPGDRVEHPIFK